MTRIGAQENGIVGGGYSSQRANYRQNLYAERLRVFMKIVRIVHFDWCLRDGGK